MSGCTVDTPEGRCGRPLEGRGMCSGHYQWASGHGWERPTHALRLRRPKDAVCQIDTHEGRCGRGPVVGRDMCDGHYAWSRKRGWEVPTHALRFRSRGTRRERTTKREPRLFPQRSGLSIPRSIKPSDLPCMTDVEMDLWSEANAVLEVPGSPCNDCTLAFAAEMQGLGLCRYMGRTADHAVHRSTLGTGRSTRHGNDASPMGCVSAGPAGCAASQAHQMTRSPRTTSSLCPGGVHGGMA